jgi:hypothetical protein
MKTTPAPGSLSLLIGLGFEFRYAYGAMKRKTAAFEIAIVSIRAPSEILSRVFV